MRHLKIKPTATEQELLTHMYEGKFLRHEDSIDLVAWFTSRGGNKTDAVAAYRRIDEEWKLISSGGTGLFPEIARSGIDFVERQGWAEQLATQNNDIRAAIILHAADTRRQHGQYNDCDFTELLASNSYSKIQFYANCWYLRDRGVLKVFAQSFVATDLCLLCADHILSLREFAERWEMLKGPEGESNPQKRGHDLENILADFAEFEGLNVKRRTRTPSEENDLIISFDFLHFIVSCKWEKRGAKPNYLDILRDRIEARGGHSLGLLVSVGGFSPELVEEATSNLSLGAVLFVGAGDLTRLFNGDLQLERLLKERHTELVRYEKIVFAE